MKLPRLLLSFVVALGCIAGNAEAARLALIVGNDNYKSVERLRNARADAEAMAQSLREAGFSVSLHLDVGDRAFKQALRDFKAKISGGDEVVFFFSGHGVQIQSSNFLLPVDIRGETEDQVRDEALPLQRVLDDFQDQKARFTLAIIDACRNNPFRTNGRSLGGRGLSPTHPASGQMVMYAAGTGQQALDRLGNNDTSPNGVFTRVLLNEMKKPGLPADRMLKQVREQVIALAKRSNHEQVPAIYDQSIGDFYFKGQAPEPQRPAAAAQSPEDAAWQVAQQSNGLAAYEAFLSAFPDGRYAAAARVAVASLRPTAAPVVTAALQPQRRETGATSSRARTVRIGHAGPLSGAQRHYGKDNENGVRMAADEINETGLVIGGERIHLEVVSLDDESTPRLGTAVAEKFCEMGVAGVVGHLNSGTSIPASRVYAQCGIPNVTGSATNPNLTRPQYKTTFRLIADDAYLGTDLADRAAQMGVRTVAVIDDRTAYGQLVASAFKEAALRRGLRVVEEQFTSDKAVDFTAILSPIKAKYPDAIFYGGMDSQAGPMLRQIDQMGMGNIKFFGGDGICTSEIARLAGGARSLENVFCAEGGATLSKMPGGTAWKTRYDRKYPSEFQVYSPYTYDATFVLVDAMKRANSTDPKVYGAKIPETNFRGVTASISFQASGELKDAATTLYTYRNGRKTPL